MGSEVVDHKIQSMIYMLRFNVQVIHSRSRSGVTFVGSGILVVRSSESSRSVGFLLNLFVYICYASRLNFKLKLYMFGFHQQSVTQWSRAGNRRSSNTLKNPY